MKYIDKLKEVANDELEFQKALLNIKDEIKLTTTQTREVKTLLKNCKEYCKNRLKEDSDNKYIHVLTAHDFCMFTLERLLTKREDFYKTKRSFIKEMLRDSTLSSDVSNTLNEQFNEEVFNIFEVCFSEETGYWLSKDSVDHGVRIFNHMLSKLKFEYVYKLTGLKPLVFVSDEGKKDFNITLLGVIGIIVNEDTLRDNDKLVTLYFNVINSIIESTMNILLEEILEAEDLKILSEKFYVHPENLQLEIGKELGQLITKGIEKPSYMFQTVIDNAQARRTTRLKLERYHREACKNTFSF